MSAKLIAEEGDLKGLIFSLEGRESWIIGRDPEECQFVIEDPLTSRRHLIARLTSEGITVENLSSTNPTLLNNEQIPPGIRLLQQGDTLQIGSELFRFYADPAAHLIEEDSAAQNFTVSLNQQNLLPEERPGESVNGHHPLFEENEASLADITFGVSETGRWLLKVIHGPNMGAEFYMQAGHHYILGTDPHACDIIFQDTSVSRQHARLSVTDDDTLMIEDLKSRNGVLISGKPLDGKQPLSPSVIVTLGTTSFVIYDREGDMQTIISPLLPSIVKVLQQEEGSQGTKSQTAETSSSAVSAAPLEPESLAKLSGTSPYSKSTHHLMPFIFILFAMGLFTIVGMGVYSLFNNETVVVPVEEHTGEDLQKAFGNFPAVKYSFNKSSGRLLLLGHVLTAADKNQLMYNLQGLKFIKSIDDTGIIIDEYVWQEINSVLARNPSWKGITIHAPSAGQFILSGFLQSRQQGENLSDYMSVNFPYLDLLKNQIVVEEDVINQIQNWLQQDNLRNVVPKISAGEVSLTGSAPADKLEDVQKVITQIKEIPNIRLVNNLVRSEAPELGIVNLSDRYEVTGYSNLGGGQYSVVINGHILGENDSLDGMTITSIKPNAIFLEKDGTKYRIDYK